jgi:galactokinase/mevalonate kinase-like predicted kinase
VDVPLRADLTGGYTDVAPFVGTRTTRSISMALQNRVSVTATTNSGGRSEIVVHDSRGPLPVGGPKSNRQLARSRGLEGLLGAVLAAVGVTARVEVEVSLPLGSGAGTSGAILVAAGKALLELAGVDDVPDSSLPHFVATIERLAGHRGGLQDQLAALNGGLSAYTFYNSHLEITNLEQARSLLDGSLLAVPPKEHRRIGSSVLVDAVMNDPEASRGLHELADLGDELFAALTHRVPQLANLRATVIRIVECQRSLHPLIRRGIDDTPVWPFVRNGVVAAKPLGGAGHGSVWLLLPPVPPDVRASIELASWSVQEAELALVGLRVLNKTPTRR